MLLNGRDRVDFFILILAFVADEIRAHVHVFPANFRWKLSLGIIKLTRSQKGPYYYVTWSHPWSKFFLLFGQLIHRLDRMEVMKCVGKWQSWLECLRKSPFLTKGVPLFRSYLHEIVDDNDWSSFIWSKGLHGTHQLSMITNSPYKQSIQLVIWFYAYLILLSCRGWCMTSK